MTGASKRYFNLRRIAILLATTLSVATLVGAALPATASAITRQQVVARGMHWVKKRVPYSQRRHYRGYRQDCSGFVSMAWNTRRSYSTYTLPSVSRRIARRALRPGDAVISPGRTHAVIFLKWANSSHTRFVALEEPGRRIGHAVRRVTSWRRGSMALRRRGIRESARRVATRPPVVVVPTIAATTPEHTAAEPTATEALPADTLAAGVLIADVSNDATSTVGVSDVVTATVDATSTVGASDVVATTVDATTTVGAPGVVATNTVEPLVLDPNAALSTEVTASVTSTGTTALPL